MKTVSLSKGPQSVKVSVAVIVVQEVLISTVQRQNLLVSLHKIWLLMFCLFVVNCLQCKLPTMYIAYT